MRTFTILALMLIAVPVASAAAPSDFYVIPVATHAAGAGGTAWRTDVVIQNIQQTPVTVSMAVVESGEGLLDNIFPLSLNDSAAATVPPGGSAVLSDVLRNHRGRAETSGALLVGGDQPFVLTSRTYAAGAGGGVGETVPPVSDVVDGGTLYLPALVSNASARSNIGFVAAAGTQPLVIETALHDRGGASLGTRSFTVAPGVTTQLQFSTRSVAAAPFDEASAKMRIVSGDGTLIGYASVVDNASADASFISGGMTMNGGGASLREVLARAGER